MSKDFFAADFDPALALADPALKPPRSVRPLDNVAVAKKLVPPKDSALALLNIKSKTVEKPAPPPPPPPPPPPEPSVLEKLSESFGTSGPFAFVLRALRDRARVRVIIRRAKAVRGHCTGFVIAFDKHLNLIMKDVDEEWVTLGDEPVQKKRHVPQLFVRGDNVCVIIRLPP